eukprot:3941801-Rhodomonas_salina.2
MPARPTGLPIRVHCPGLSNGGQQTPPCHALALGGELVLLPLYEDGDCNCDELFAQKLADGRSALKGKVCRRPHTRASAPLQRTLATSP